MATHLAEQQVDMVREAGIARSIARPPPRSRAAWIAGTPIAAFLAMSLSN